MNTYTFTPGETSVSASAFSEYDISIATDPETQNLIDETIKKVKDEILESIRLDIQFLLYPPDMDSPRYALSVKFLDGWPENQPFYKLRFIGQALKKALAEINIELTSLYGDLMDFDHYTLSFSFEPNQYLITNAQHGYRLTQYNALINDASGDAHIADIAANTENPAVENQVRFILGQIEHLTAETFPQLKKWETRKVDSFLSMISGTDGSQETITPQEDLADLAGKLKNYADRLIALSTIET